MITFSHYGIIYFPKGQCLIKEHVLYVLEMINENITEEIIMKKWYDEEYVWEIEVIGFNKDNEETERFCRNGEEIGDKYTCTYGCPVNSQGLGICSKVMMMMYPIMEAVRSGGNLENIGGDSKFSKVIMCPDGCVLFRLTAKPLGNKNFFQGKFFD